MLFNASLYEVEGGLTGKCLQCGIAVLMASLSSHITDEHNDERDVPQLKVKRYTCSRQPFITDFLIFKQMPFYMLWYS